MRELIWLNSAINDLTRLRAFIAKENLEAAKRAASLLKEAALRLIKNPHIGKPVTDLIGYRELLIRFGVGGYIMRYKIYEDSIYIVHIRHYRESDFKV